MFNGGKEALGRWVQGQIMAELEMPPPLHHFFVVRVECIEKKERRIFCKDTLSLSHTLIFTQCSLTHAFAHTHAQLQPPFSQGHIGIICPTLAVTFFTTGHPPPSPKPHK